MLVLLAFALQSPTVTLTERARPMAEVVAAVASQTHSSLATEGAVGTDTIVLRVNSANLDDLKAKLAEVSKGKWVGRNDTQVLQRDDDQWRKWNAEERAELVAESDAAIAGCRDSIAGQYDPSIAAKILARDEKPLNPVQSVSEQAGTIQPKAGRGKDDSLFLMDPLARAANRIVDAIGSDALADAYEYGRAVFSTRPGTTQRPIGEESGEIVRAFNQEAAAWSKVRAEYRREHPDSQREAADEINADPYESFRKGGQAADLTLVLSSDGDSLEVTVIPQDSKGLPLQPNPDRSIERLTIFGPDDSDESAAAAIPTGDTKPILIDDEALSLMHGADQSWERSDASFVTPSLKNKLLEPTKFDPLSWFPSELLLGLAESESKNLVADLPDSELDWSNPGSSKITPKAAVELLASEDDLDVDATTAWISVKPSQPSLLEEHVDRIPLEHCLQLIAKDPGSCFDALEKDASNTDVQDERVLPFLLDYAFPTLQTNDPVEGKYPLSYLRILATLSSDQTALLDKGQSIRWSALSIEQQRLLSQWFYSERHDPSEIEWDLRSLFGVGSSCHREPTVVCPNGIPPDAELSWEHAKESAIYTKPDQSGWAEVRTVFDYRTTSLKGSAVSVETPLAIPTSCAYGSVETFLLKLDLGGGGDEMGGFRLFEPSVASFVPFKETPSSLRAQIVDATRILARALRNKGNDAGQSRQNGD